MQKDPTLRGKPMAVVQYNKFQGGELKLCITTPTRVRWLIMCGAFVPAGMPAVDALNYSNSLLA